MQNQQGLMVTMQNNYNIWKQVQGDRRCKGNGGQWLQWTQSLCCHHHEPLSLCQTWEVQHLMARSQGLGLGQKVWGVQFKPFFFLSFNFWTSIFEFVTFFIYLQILLDFTFYLLFFFFFKSFKRRIVHP